MKRSSTFEVFHSAGDDSNKEGKRPRRSQDGDRNRPRRSQDGDGNPPDGGDNPPDGDDIPGAGPIWELHTSSDVAGVQCVHALTANPRQRQPVSARVSCISCHCLPSQRGGGGGRTGLLPAGAFNLRLRPVRSGRAGPFAGYQ